MNERMRRLKLFCETGAIGVYDADDLHADVRWLVETLERKQLQLNHAVHKIEQTLQGQYPRGEALQSVLEVIQQDLGIVHFDKTNV